MNKNRAERFLLVTRHFSGDATFLTVAGTELTQRPSIGSIKRMNSLRYLLLSFVIAITLASCGEPERAKPAASTSAARAGSDFDQVGRVSLYPGESCASQIMFVFRTARSTSTSLAAPFRVSKILTDAAHDRRSVHVWGKWRRGKAPGCSYVEATQVEVQNSFW